MRKSLYIHILSFSVVVLLLITQMGIWQYLLLGIVIPFLIYRFGRFLMEQDPCVRCNGEGKLNGYDPYVELYFNDDKCYLCDGKGIIPFDERKKLHNIIIRANGAILDTKREAEDIFSVLARYRAEIQISPFTAEVILKSYENIIKQNLELLESVDHKCKIHQSNRQKSYIHAYNIYQSKLNQFQRNKIESWENYHLNSLEEACQLTEELVSYQEYELEPYIELQKNKPDTLFLTSLRKEIEMTLSELSRKLSL